MGVFTVVGLGVSVIGVATKNSWIIVLGMTLFGVGVAGDVNGY